jgi:hypothetical protein
MSESSKAALAKLRLLREIEDELHCQHSMNGAPTMRRPPFLELEKLGLF